MLGHRTSLAGMPGGREGSGAGTWGRSGRVTPSSIVGVHSERPWLNFESTSWLSVVVDAKRSIKLSLSIYPNEEPG